MQRTIGYIIIFVFIYIMIQCKSNESQVVTSKNIGITYSPTFVVDSHMIEHQYEGKDTNSLVRVEITNKVESIPQWAFAIVPSLEEVRLSPSVKVIDDNAFFSCKKLSEINLEHVEVVGENCFKFSALEEICLTSARKIREFAFSNCLKLRNIKFSDRLKAIGDFAFSGDSALVNCHIPTGKIGASAFMGCTNMEQLSLGKVSSIGDAAFLDCTSLKSVVIPSTMKEIGCEAFSGCINLKEVIVNSHNTKIAEDAFAKDVIITYIN